MNEEKRKADKYIIIQALHIGDREIVIGEDSENQEGQKYMCAFYSKNELFGLYNEVLSSDDYLEIVEVYGQRVAEQAQKTRAELITPKIQEISNAPLTTHDCIPISYDDDLNGRVIVIKSEVLRPEYRMASCQIMLCTGGFGAFPHSSGSACFCVDLYSGKKSRFERWDILGTLEPEQLPEWAKLGLKNYQRSQSQQQEKVSKRKEKDHER